MRQKRWDTLNAASLEKRLIEHGVIRLDDIGKDDDKDNPTLMNRPPRQYIPAMVEIARQCVADENKRASGHESSSASN